jgi:cation diffusion facilitator CzcD-associated flavoprotein CzcO
MATVQKSLEMESGQDAVHVDVLIVGAGVSGIGTALHLRRNFPGLDFVILEAKESYGGTWWTHRFPGIRSDSDLFTYGYRDRPWRGPAIASAGAIRDYLGEVIAEEGLSGKIRYQHRVTALEWSSADNTWSANVARDDTDQRLAYSANFLWMCHGYYDHDTPFMPEWEGVDRYAGTLVHSEQWPEALGYDGKRVLVVGSGATAATMCPVVAQTARQVTMLQRSPTYFFAAPAKSDLQNLLEPLNLPDDWTHEILRRHHTLMSDWLTQTCRENPEAARQYLLEEVRKLLPEDADMKDFTPSYPPWEQRLVVVKDGDFFERMRAGKLSVITDTIDEFVKDGVKLASGKVVEADIVVAATGFHMTPFGDIPFSVDDAPVDFSKRVTWRGIMIEGIPNMAFAFGYFRYSWTLRVDLSNDLVGRIFRLMDRRGAATVVPKLRPQDRDMERRPWVDSNNISAGYMMRALERLHRQGDRDPWRQMFDYDYERSVLPAADIDDGLEYR